MKKEAENKQIMQVLAVRGATTVDSDTAADIKAAVIDLMDELCAENLIFSGDTEIVSCILSSTKDITAMFPAAAAREFGLHDAPLFSCQEPDIAGSLPLCVRVLLTAACTGKAMRSPKHIYLKGAKVLRPDLNSK